MSGASLESGILPSTAARLVCSAFLQKDPRKKKALLSYLPQEESAPFQALSSKSPQEDLSLGLSSEEVYLKRIHSSWLAPFLRTLSFQEISFFLATLEAKKAASLKEALLFSEELPRLSSLAKLFIRRFFQMPLCAHMVQREKELLPTVTPLFERLPAECLPYDCLPVSPLNALLELEFSELLLLIHLLSMHDLKVELKQIIDSNLLKEIYRDLPQEVFAYLKSILSKKEPVVFKKMGLESYKNDPDKLRSFLTRSLEQRGINRLAKALAGEHPSLTWYVAHHLDTSRGLLLTKLCTPLADPQATASLTEQIAHLCAEIPKKRPKNL